MSFLESALSAAGQSSSGGVVGAVQGLLSKLVSNAEVTAKLDAILKEHNIPVTSQQVLGFLKEKGMVEQRDQGVIGTPALGNLQELLPQLLGSLSGGAGGLGGGLGGLLGGLKG